jgi:asparagine synthase (glutamine-hydrolysing)
MCGILALVSTERKRLEAGLLPVENLLFRRGPDAAGSFLSSNGDAYLHHSRLAVIDISDAGAQPMTIGSVTMIFNGMVYNYKELRDRYLNDADFIGNSDTEVVLRMFLKVGVGAFALLEGMFAICIWDSRTNDLIYLRDRLGIKPLYSRRIKGAIAIASEPKALLGMDVSRSLNEDAISDYLVFQTYLTESRLLDGIESIEPGKVFSILNGVPRILDKFDNQKCNSKLINEKEFRENLKDLFPLALESHLISDTPVTSLLSGGLDSSLCLILMSKSERFSSISFSGVYPDFPETSELEFAKVAAKKADSDLRIIEITKEKYLNSFFSMIEANDFPVAGPPGPSLHYILSNIADEFKVAIGGLGGDELFLGYARHWLLLENIAPEFRELQDFGQDIKRSIDTFSNYSAMRKSFALETKGYPLWRKYAWLLDRTHEFPKSELLMHHRKNAYARFESVFESIARDSDHIVTTLRRFDLKVVLPSLLQIDDRSSMHNGVELRVPMLDSRLLDLVNSADPSLFLRHGPKGLIKQVFGDILPESIRNRNQKHGFPTPFNSWINQEFASGENNRFNQIFENSVNLNIYKELNLNFKDTQFNEQFSNRNFWGPLNLFCSLDRLDIK